MRIASIRPCRIAGLYEILSESYVDSRGSMRRIYDQRDFEAAGLTARWIQESYSLTQEAGTLRGLHVSLPPMLEGKLIVPLSGRTQWIALDLRQNSPTFGQVESTILDAESQNALYAEKGFAHGSLSLSDHCGLYLKADSLFQDATGIHWQDPELAIPWELKGRIPLVSAAHEAYGSFASFRERFGGLNV